MTQHSVGQVMYAHRVKTLNNPHGIFMHIYSVPEVTKMCCDTEQIIKISVREVTKGENSEYWGWQNDGEGLFSMIYPSIDLLRMCFPYGVEAEVENGKGRIVNLMINEIE